MNEIPHVAYTTLFHIFVPMKHELKDCLGYRLRKITRIIDGHFKKMLTDFEITENQMTILFTLFQLGSVEQGKIGKVLALERSTVSRNIRLLEKLSLVEKTEQYRPEVQLSRKGEELAKTLLPLWNSVMDELVGQIGNEGMQHIRKIEKALR